MDAHTADPLDDEDARILALLGQAHDVRDPVPDGLVDRVNFAITVAALEAEVAELTVMTAERAGVRSEMEMADTVTFSGADLTAMIAIEPEPGGGRRVSGWASATPVSVELRGVEHTVSTRTDDQGHFEFLLAEPGLVHLVLQRLDGTGYRPLVTPPFGV
ncbi:MAG: hypothetical protein ACI379_06870 [Nocardioides sp.]|uniref:hypothetical protein n=1 Tax=Nocardioides sp. TaxID=35761 RepID=UPI003EFE9EDC